jgi:hypothetical protein
MLEGFFVTVGDAVEVEGGGEVAFAQGAEGVEGAVGARRGAGKFGKGHARIIAGT